MVATAGRFALAMRATVIEQRDVHFAIHEGTVYARVFRAFPKRLVAIATNRNFLVVHGRSIHNRKLVLEDTGPQNSRLSVCFLPPYSGHHDSDEHMQKHVKANAPSARLPTRAIRGLSSRACCGDCRR